SPRARCRNRPEFDSPSLRVRLAAFSPAGSTPPRAALAPLAATLLPEGTSVEDEIRRRGGLRLRPLGLVLVRIGWHRRAPRGARPRVRLRRPGGAGGSR